MHGKGFIEIGLVRKLENFLTNLFIKTLFPDTKFQAL